MYTSYTDQMQDTYLQHYGVIGMKWGVKRGKRIESQAAATRKKAQAAKSAGKMSKYEKLSSKASKQQAHANKIAKKHNALAGKKQMDYAANQSWGKTIVKTALMGSYGTLKYNQLRTHGVSKGKAAVAGMLSGSINRMSGGIVSVAEPRATAAAKKNMTSSQKKSLNKKKEAVVNKKNEAVVKAKNLRKRLSY